MARRLGDMVAARYWDNEAAKHMKRFAEFAARADKAHTAESRKRWQEAAREERDKAIECLEKAKVLDGGGVE
ncbi:MAG: hypothetical protein KGM47_16980 [Acidobacteriota bacterium]|nr:hypothetical protein [Acidobacteriota bacterium]